MGAMTPSFRLVELHPGKAPLIPPWSRRVRWGRGAGEAARGFVNTDKGPSPSAALSRAFCPRLFSLMKPNTASRWREGFQSAA